MLIHHLSHISMQGQKPLLEEDLAQVIGEDRILFIIQSSLLKTLRC